MRSKTGGFRSKKRVLVNIFFGMSKSMAASCSMSLKLCLLSIFLKELLISNNFVLYQILILMIVTFS